MALLDSHCFGHPQTDAASYQSEPDHEVIRPVAFKFGDGIPYEAGMYEERRDSRDGVMLPAKC